MTKGTFWFPFEKYGKLLQKETTCMATKTCSLSQEACHYCYTLGFSLLEFYSAVGTVCNCKIYTVIAIIHEGFTMLHREFVTESIRDHSLTKFCVTFSLSVGCHFVPVCLMEHMKIRKPMVFACSTSW